MPQTRRGVFPVLLPLIVIVPVAVALCALLVAALQARGAGDEASRRARDELRLAARDFEAAARARQAAAELLSRSPALRAWASGTEVPGEETRGDLATVAGLFPGKAAVTAARASDSAMIGAGTAAAEEPGALKASAAIRQGDSTVGEVILQSSADELAGEVPRATAGNAIVAITDGVGILLHLSGAAVAGARTISDIFPRIERRIFISAMEAPPAADGIRLFDDRVGGTPVMIAAARLPVGDWRLFVAVPVERALRPSLRGAFPQPVMGVAPILLLAALVLVAVAALAGLFVWTALAAARMRRGFSEELDHEQWKLREARAGLEECMHLAGEAHDAITRAGDAARSAAVDTDGASAAAGEAKPLVTESGALLRDRAGRLARAAAAAAEATRLADAASSSAVEGRSAASRAEEELARVIPAVGSAAQAATRIRARVSAIGTLAERARLLSLNAAVDAARGEDGARKLLRAVEEIQGLASRASESARSLATECAAVAGDAQTARVGAEEAGRAAHAARQGAEDAGAVIGVIGEKMRALQSDAEAGALAGAGVASDASLADRAGSALEGLQRICARIAASLRESGEAATQAGQKCDQITRAGQAGPSPG